MSDEPIRITRGQGGEVDVEGPVDGFAASVLKRARFETYPTLRGVWIRLPFDLGRTWENEHATWAAEMLAAARYSVDLDPDLRAVPPTVSAPSAPRRTKTAMTAQPAPAGTPRRQRRCPSDSTQRPAALTPSAAISLHLSSDHTIVALPSGERHQWAITALELAGFAREHRDEAHRLSLDDHASAREALTRLHQTAQDCQAKVITSERPYFGDVARAVAQALPGQWDVSIEHYPDGTLPSDLLDWVWETSPVLSTLTNYRAPGAAILRDGGGTELLLAERAWDGRYLIGTLLPSPDHLNIVGEAAPRTVIAATAREAVADLRSRLLPEFEQLVHLARIREVQEDLDWAQRAEPGTVDAAELDAAVDRFLTHAPYLIAATRRAAVKPLAASETAILVRFETLLSRAPSEVGAQAAPAQGRPDEALVLWIEDGQDLLDAVRTATVSPAGEPSRPAVTTAVPPKPPAAVSAARTR